MNQAALYTEWNDLFWDAGNPYQYAVKYLKPGAKVNVIGAKGEYYQIQYQGQTYWISIYDVDYTANESSL